MCKHPAMKKLFTALFVLTAIYGQSQISLTRSDFAVAGYSFLSATDTTPSITLGNGGTGQTWDFTGLKAHETTTNSFNDGSSVSMIMPGCNLMLVSSAGDSTFFNASNTALSGIFPGMDFIPGAPQLKMITFPFTYGNSVTDSANYSIVSRDTVLNIYDSLRIGIRFIISNSADGEGTLKLPVGDFAVLRMRVDITFGFVIEVKSAFLTGGKWTAAPFSYPDTKVSAYQFMGNGNGWTVAVVSQDDKNNITSVEYRTWSTGIKSSGSNNPIQVYPNPASTSIQVAGLPSGTQIRITDLSGHTWVNQTVQGMVPVISVAELPRGMYLLNSTLANGESVVQKFVLQ